jgi:RNA polymerase sigma-70 factor (ECF subfamily)
MNPIDPAILGKCFDAYGAGLVLYARQWLDVAQAEEVVQDAFLQMMSLRKSPQSEKAWLFTAVRNAAISRLRSQQRSRKHTERLAGERSEWFSARADDAIDAATAQEALAGLLGEQREVIVLRIWAGMTLQEIADVTGQPVSTLFSRYQAGLAELRKRMGSPCEKKMD